MYGHVASTLQGLTTIRAHKSEKVQTNEFDKRQVFIMFYWTYCQYDIIIIIVFTFDEIH